MIGRCAVSQLPSPGFNSSFDPFSITSTPCASGRSVSTEISAWLFFYRPNVAARILDHILQSQPGREMQSHPHALHARQILHRDRVVLRLRCIRLDVIFNRFGQAGKQKSVAVSIRPAAAWAPAPTSARSHISRTA